MAPDSILHITLNTGDTRESPRSEVDPDIYDTVFPVIEAGSGFVVDKRTIATITADGNAWTFDLSIPQSGKSNHPIILGAVVADHKRTAEVWNMLEIIYRRSLRFASRATMPKSAPWVAVMVLPVHPREIRRRPWLGDFERCLAWALIEGPDGERTE